MIPAQKKIGKKPDKIGVGIRIAPPTACALERGIPSSSPISKKYIPVAPSPLPMLGFEMTMGAAAKSLPRPTLFVSSAMFLPFVRAFAYSALAAFKSLQNVEFVCSRATTAAPSAACLAGPNLCCSPPRQGQAPPSLRPGAAE